MTFSKEEKKLINKIILYLTLLIFLIAFVVAVVTVAILRYQECRDFGHSVLYCIGR